MTIRTSWVIAGGIALVAVAWIGSGAVMPADKPAQQAAVRSAAETAAADDKPVRVRVRTLTAQPALDRLVVHGQTEPERMLELKAETSGRVEAIPPARGSVVQTGDVLVRLAIKDREERRAQAESLVAQRQLEYDQARQLGARDYVSKTRLAEARAALEAAQAGLAAIRIEISDVTVTAPFTAVFNDHPVEVGAFVEPGTVVATLIDLDPIKVRAEVSEREVEEVAVGATGSVRLIDGRTLDGTVTWVSQAANAQTRTYQVEMRVPNPDLSIPAGMTAELRLPLESHPAHLVSPAVLTLNDAGIIGVKVVSEDERVAFHEAQILSDGPGGMWLMGLPQTVRLITVGQEYVKVGQKVEPVEEDATAAAPSTPAVAN